MIRKAILALAISLSTVAHAEIRELKQSIFKIMITGPRGVGVATTFAVSYKNKKYMVTNNHVCHGFHTAFNVSLIKSETKSTLPEFQEELADQDKVTEYYMEPGSDICIFRTERTSSYKALTLNTDGVSPTDDILVSGFVGRALDLMYVQGKVYGSVNVPLAQKLNDCASEPPSESDQAGQITCKFFPSYPSWSTKKLQIGMNNIGPGFSGSPVIKNDLVVGIVAMYRAPTEEYTNGDAIFFPASNIKTALINAEKNMKPVKTQDYNTFLRISDFTSALNMYIQQTTQGMRMLIRELLRDNE